MKFWDRIKSFFKKENSPKELPSPEKISNKEDDILQNINSFIEDLKNIENPFSNILKPENMKTINIDEKAIPVFEKTIRKIEKYFVTNNLLNVKDFENFFSEYLLNNNLEIRYADIEELPEGSGAVYDKDKKRILLSGVGNSKMQINTLCHEFIHFMVMADSNKLSWCPSKINFINEAYTELLTSEITEMNPQCYLKGIDMVKFFNLITGNQTDWQKSFLRDEFNMGDEYLWNNVNNISLKNENIESYRQIQREIINRCIDTWRIDSIDSYLKIIDILSQRASFDKEFMTDYFNRLNKTFIENMQISDNQDLINLLNNYCKVSYYAKKCGNSPIEEYEIEDISGAYDKDGNIYGDFPDGGTSFSPNKKFEITHNKQTKIYSLEKFIGTDFNKEYDKMKKHISEIFNYNLAKEESIDADYEK